MKRFHSLILIVLFSLLNLETHAQVFEYTFTNAGASGNTGPTQTQINSSYAGTSLENKVTINAQGIQEWIVPVTGIYTITGQGASGRDTPNAIGGRGRVITIDVSLTAGDIIEILVGQIGGIRTFESTSFGLRRGYAGGGGGGTFIVNKTTNSPILICGGGGGSATSLFYQPANINGRNASEHNIQSGQPGVSSQYSWSPAAAGGSNGLGGLANSGGSGGGGYLGTGQMGNFGGHPGSAYVNNGLGGLNRNRTTTCNYITLSNVEGGFGGGAGSGSYCNYEVLGGAGGGYSGGGGAGARIGAGGGGGNFYTGTFISSALNTGNGSVNITLNCDTSDATAGYSNEPSDGFGTWSFPHSGNAGNFISSALNNNNGNPDTNNDGDINSAGVAWGTFANSGGIAQLIRSFDSSLNEGDTFSIQIDIGANVDNGMSTGFSLRNDNGENLLEVFFRKQQNGYFINDLNGESQIPYSGFYEGQQIDIVMTSPTTVDVKITQLVNGINQTFSSTLKNPPGGQSISTLRMFNFNSGPGSDKDVFFNNLEICRAPIVCNLVEVTANVTDASCPTAEDGGALLTFNYSGSPVDIEGSFDGTNYQFQLGPSSDLTVDNFGPGTYELFFREVGQTDCVESVEFTIGVTPNATDADGDGVTLEDCDCDDNDASVFPEAPELCDGVDNDCDGLVDDDDGGLIIDGIVLTALSGTDLSLSPVFDPNTFNYTAEVCNSVTETQISATASSDLPFASVSGDGFVALPNIGVNTITITVESCLLTQTYSIEITRLPEVLYYADVDGDGFGNANDPGTPLCSLQAGFSDNNLDCDDSEATVNPSAPEINCDGLDNDCNPNTPDNLNPATVNFNVTDITYGPVSQFEFGVDFISGTDFTFVSGGNIPSDPGGNTYNLTDLLPQNYGGLWYTFNRIENPRLTSEASTGDMVFHSFDPNTGIVTFHSTAPLTYPNAITGGTDSVNTQFRFQLQPVGAAGPYPLSAAAVSGLPANIIDANAAGLPGLGLDWKAIDVKLQGDFQVWFAFEVQGTNEPLGQFYNDAPTVDGVQFGTSVFSTFYGAEDICVNPGNEITMAAVPDANNTAPFIYTFNNITNTSGVFPGIAAGTYDYSVLADNGCLTEGTYSAGAPDSSILSPVPDENSLQDITAQCEVNTLNAPTATAVCGGTIQGTTTTSLPITATGTTVVTWTYNDPNGGTTTQIQNVVIEDTQAPTALCRDVTVQLDQNGTASISVENELLASSSTDFSGVQGQDGWTYGQLQAVDLNNFIPLPNFTGAIWNNPGVGQPFDFPQIDANGGHPAENGGFFAVRRWTSNYTGEITVSGDFFDRDGSCGDGAHVRILLNNVQVYEFLDIPTNSTPYSISINVASGDTIDFAIDPKFDAGCDDTHFVANISTTAGINNGSSDNCGNITTSIDINSFDCDDLNDPGAAAVFTSGPDTILMGASSSLNVSNALSFEAWIYPTGNGSPTNGGIIVNKEGEYEIARYPNGTIQWAIANSNPGWVFVNTGAVAPLNQWTHIAFSYSGAVAKTFINGVLTHSIPASGIIGDSFPPDNNFRIGGRNPSIDQYFQGYIDEVRVWNTGLSDSQISNQYNMTIDAPSPGLIGYWSLDEGSGNITQDLSGNGNNGSFTAQTSWITPGAVVSNSNNVTLTVTDDSGNQSTCIANVTVIDNLPPEVTCPADISVNATSANGAEVNFTVDSSDNCTVESTSISTAPTTGLASGSTFPIGTTTVTYTVTDASNNTASCSFDVEVVGVAPDIVCPANITVENDAGQCGAIVTFASTETVGIPASNITYSHPSGSEFPVGTTTVTATATNAVGTSQCTFEITVNDTEDPIIDCAADVTINNTPGECYGEVVLTPPTVSDNCSITDNALNFDGINDYVELPGTWGGTPEQTIEAWVYVDATTSNFQAIASSPNTSYLHFQLFSAGNNAAYLNNGSAVLPIIPQTPIQTWKHVAMVVQSGNSKVYVNGTQLGGTVATAYANILATNDLTIGRGYQDGRFMKGSIDELRIWNSARTQAEIAANMNTTLLGSESGLIAYYDFEDGPGSSTLTDKTGNGNHGTLVNMDTVNDWVSGRTNELTVTNNAPATYAIGDTTVTWTATDAAGNTSQCTQTVTVIDNEIPVMVTNSLIINLIDRNDYVLSQAQIDELGSLSSDNCELSFSITNGQTIYNCASVGQTFDLELTGTDSSGNTSNVIVQVSVTDSNSVCNDPPTASCKDVVLTTGADCDATLLSTDLNDGSSDPDGDPLTYTITEIDGSSVSLTSTVLSVGVYNVTLTVSDGEFEDTCTAQVSVVDSTPPVALTKPATVQLDASGNGSITPEDVDNGSSDACGIQSLALSKTTFDCNNVGDNIVTLTVTDVNGNVSSATATVTVVDSVNPVVVTNDITVQLDATGNVSIDAADINNGSSDNCAISTYELDIDSFDCDDIQGALNTNNTVVVTLTVTDVNGNSASAPATVTVEDNVNPVVVTNDITVQLDATGNVSIDAADINNGSSDNCAISTYELDIDSFDCDNIQGALNTNNTVVVTLTVTDVNGNSASAPATVTVEDNVNPVVVTNDITVQLDATGNVSIDAADINNGSSDNCAISTYELDIDSFDCDDIQGALNTNNTVVVTLTVTDVNGNSASAPATVTVEDNVNPVVVTNDITVQLDATGNVSIDAADINSGSSDNCAISTYELDIDSFDCDDIQGALNTNNTVVVTLTVTDVNGNSASAPATVTVEDNVNPVVVTNDITVQLDATGNVSIDAADINNGSSDNCAISTYELDIDSFDCDNIQGALNTNNTVVVTLTVTDVNGNSASAPATVTVEDNVNPVVVTNDITVQLDATGNVSIDAADINNGSSDNCAISTYELDIDSFDCDDIQGALNTNNTVVVTLTVTDVNGNSASAPATVTVEDNVNPVVVTNDITVQLDATGNVSIDAADINSGSSDNCAISTYELDIDSFDCDDIQGALNTNNTVVVTLTVTDVNGNSASAPATVTVEDNVNPVVVTNDITVQLDATGNVSIDAADINNGSSDNCAISTYELDIDSFDCDDIQGALNTNNTVVVTLTVTDVNGNSASAPATVTVEDNVNPVVVTNDITVQLDATGNVSIDAADINNGSSDNCAISTYELDIDSFDCDDIQGALNTNNTVVVTLTVTDVNGNSASAPATVTVEDNVNPVAVTNDITVQLDATGNVSIDAADINNGSSDNCAISTYELDIDSFDCDDIQGALNTNNTVVVTLTVTDVNGNSASAPATVTVEDNVPPVAIAQNVTVQLDDEGNGSITPADIDNGSNDSCGIQSLELSQTEFGCNNLGDNQITLTVTDINGNVSTATATVTVIDEIAPVINCAQVEVILTANGSGSLSQAQLDLIENTVTDNCAVESVVLAQTDFDCSDIGGDLDELIISEYIDGSEEGEVANKYIEIFNGTGTAVNLFESGYELVVYTDNFNPTPITIELLGVIQDRDVHVISFPSAQLAGTVSDQTPNLFFNGNDAIALTKNGSAVDILGVIGENPVGGWTSGNNSTQGTRLVRNIDVLQGNVLGDNSGLASEWTSYPLNSYDSESEENTLGERTLGSHDIDIEGNNNNVLLTATDTSGNVTTCEVQVQVIDNTDPTVLTQDIEVFLDENGEVVITPAQINDGSSDSCGIANLALDNSEFNCGDVGPNTVTLTVTDVNGNSATETAVVTVTDNLDPIVVTQDITVALDANGNATITPNQIDNGSSDNCEIDELTLDVSSFTCADIGPNTVTLTVLDVNGNSSSETAVVTIKDNTSPNAVCQNISVTLNSEGKATITGADVDGGSADACGISSLSVFPNEFGCDDIGDNQVTLTVTDNNGNESTCTATVTVNGDIPTVNVTQSDLPEFCQGAFVILTAEGTNINTYEWFYEDDLVGTDSTYEVEVGQEGLYEVVVTSATNCIASTTFTVNPIDFGGLLSAYTILGTEEVFLTGSNTVISGGVGAMLPGAGNVKLHQASTVADFTQAETISLQQGSTTGQQILSPANPTLPVFMFNTVSNATSPDIIVTGNQTLTSDVYDVIDVREGATVTFTQPNVFINELKTQKESAIEFTGCTNVLLNERFQLAQNSTINSNEENVTFYVDGDVSIEKGSSVTASIFAYNHNLLVKGLNGNGNKEPEPTYMNGLFIANRVQGNKNVIWNAFGTCETCEVEYPNANRKIKDDLVVTEFDVKGWPSPSTDIFNLKVHTLNKSDKVSISVFDIANKLLHSGQFKHTETYTFGKELEGGVYIVRIAQGSDLKVLRLIKE